MTELITLITDDWIIITPSFTDNEYIHNYELLFDYFILLSDATFMKFKLTKNESPGF